MVENEPAARFERLVLPRLKKQWAKNGKYEYCYQISDSNFRSIGPLNRSFVLQIHLRVPKNHTHRALLARFFPNSLLLKW